MQLTPGPLLIELIALPLLVPLASAVMRLLISSGGKGTLLTSPLGHLLHPAVHVGQQQDIGFGEHKAPVDVCWVRHSIAVHSRQLVHSDSPVEVVRAWIAGNQQTCVLTLYSGSTDHVPDQFPRPPPLVTGELSTLRQMMELPNEPGLSPNNGLENAFLSDENCLTGFLCRHCCHASHTSLPQSGTEPACQIRQSAFGHCAPLQWP